MFCYWFLNVITLISDLHSFLCMCMQTLTYFVLWQQQKGTIEIWLGWSLLFMKSEYRQPPPPICSVTLFLCLLASSTQRGKHRLCSQQCFLRHALLPSSPLEQEYARVLSLSQRKIEKQWHCYREWVGEERGTLSQLRSSGIQWNKRETNH